MDPMGARSPMDPTMNCEPMDRSASSLEDDLLFQEALAIIGDLGDDESEASAEDASATNGPSDAVDECAMLEGLLWPGNDAEVALAAAVSIPVPARKDKNAMRTQTRRRVELLHLHEQVKDLEDQLAALRAAGKQDKAHKEDDQDERLGISSKLWMNVAWSQHAQRRLAERENAKLKQLLQDHLQVRENLEKVLRRKRQSSEVLEMNESPAKRLHLTSLQTWDRSPIYDELIASCAQLNGNTPSVLACFSGGWRIPTPRKVELVHGPDFGVMLQTTEQRILPFNYEETASELWGLFQTVPSHRSILQFDSFHDPEQEVDTTKLRFSVKVQTVHSSGEFAIKAVKRRYVEAQRVIIVYSARMEPSEVSDTKMDGISVRETAWHIIEPIPGKRSSIMTAYCASIPEIDAEIPGHEHKIDTLTSFLSSAIPVEFDACNLLLENQLIERSLHRDRQRCVF